MPGFPALIILNLWTSEGARGRGIFDTGMLRKCKFLAANYIFGPKIANDYLLAKFGSDKTENEP